MVNSYHLRMRKLATVLVLTTIAVSAFAQAQKKWIPADRAVACAEATDQALCAQLLDLVDRDQFARYAEINDPGNAALKDATARVDAANIIELEAILEKVGWPGKSMVGTQGSGAVWTILQHSQHATLKKHLPLMIKAAEAGEIDGGLLATSVDRVRVGDGLPQVYGTQFQQVNGEWVPRPIEDEANVDARRKSVGLGPLSDYVAMFHQMHSRKAKE